MTISDRVRIWPVNIWVTPKRVLGATIKLLRNLGFSLQIMDTYCSVLTTFCELSNGKCDCCFMARETKKDY